MIDLKHTGSLDILPESSYLEDAQVSGHMLGTFDFKKWATISADFLVKGAFSVQDDELKAELRLYDVRAQREVIAKLYTTRATDLPNTTVRIGHTFADEIVFQLTGKRGTFLAEYCFRNPVLCP